MIKIYINICVFPLTNKYNIDVNIYIYNMCWDVGVWERKKGAVWVKSKSKSNKNYSNICCSWLSSIFELVQGCTNMNKCLYTLLNLSFLFSFTIVNIYIYFFYSGFFFFLSLSLMCIVKRNVFIFADQ